MKNMYHRMARFSRDGLPLDANPWPPAWLKENKTAMNHLPFEDAMRLQAERVEKAWGAVLSMALDLEHLNRESKECKEATRIFLVELEILWRIKCMWVEVTR